MNVFEQKNAELVTEFDRYVRKHPDLPTGFRTTHWWLCWLKGIKNLIAGVKKGQSARLKKNNPLFM